MAFREGRLASADADVLGWLSASSWCRWEECEAREGVGEPDRVVSLASSWSCFRFLYDLDFFPPLIF